MVVRGHAKFVRVSSGKNKEDKPYYFLRFLDEDADNFINLFTDETVFNKLNHMSIAKGDDVVLTLNATVGFKRTYLSLIDVEMA